MSRSISTPFSRRHRVFHGHKVEEPPRARQQPRGRAVRLFVQERLLLVNVVLPEAVVTIRTPLLMVNEMDH